jgi:hypothetical protein
MLRHSVYRLGRSDDIDVCEAAYGSHALDQNVIQKPSKPRLSRFPYPRSRSVRPRDSTCRLALAFREEAFPGGLLVLVSSGKRRSAQSVLEGAPQLVGLAASVDRNTN